MRGAWWLAAAGAFIMAGCGDPATSRLPVGSRAMAVDHYKHPGSRGLFLEETGRDIYPEVVYGTHLSVVDDSADPEHDWGTRKVLVHVEDGEHRGITGKATRHELHPIN